MSVQVHIFIHLKNVVLLKIVSQLSFTFCTLLIKYKLHTQKFLTKQECSINYMPCISMHYSKIFKIKYRDIEKIYCLTVYLNSQKYLTFLVDLNIFSCEACNAIFCMSGHLIAFRIFLLKLLNLKLKIQYSVCGY